MVKEVGLFLLGGACGFAGATLLLKSRYEAMVKESDEAAMNWVMSKTGEKKDGEKVEDPVIKHSEEMTKYNEIKDKKKYDTRPMEEVKSSVYRISEADFAIDDLDYDKVSLEYYTEDESLYEEGGSDVANIDDVVGLDNISYLHGSMDDVIYVRNEDLRTDYEVIKIVGSFMG